jgi:hypothetical protein
MKSSADETAKFQHDLAKALARWAGSTVLKSGALRRAATAGTYGHQACLP